MDFTPNPLHQEIRDAVARICADFPDDYWYRHDESKEFPWDFYNAIVKGGWLGLTVPEEYGGGGLGVTEAAIVEQTISASGAGMNGCSAVHIGIFGFEPIIRHGSEELKRRVLPRLASGECHLSFAVTEPDAGTDTTNISTFARKVDGGWSISGKKVWITKAQQAERLMILCRTAPRDASPKKTAGMTLFFAPMDRAKVDVRPIPKMGRNAINTNELFIDDLFVADEDVIGEVGRRVPGDPRRPERRAGHLRQRGRRHRPGGAAPGHELRQGAQGLRPADRAEPGPRVPARRRR